MKTEIPLTGWRDNAKPGEKAQGEPWTSGGLREGFPSATREGGRERGGRGNDGHVPADDRE